MLSSIPQPPQGMHMNTTAQAIFTLGQAVPCLVFAFIAWRIWQKERSPIPALCMLGGAFAMFMEPIVDVLGQVWFPRQGQWVLFETWGRPIPWFIVVYIWYVGGQSVITFRSLERGALARDIWKLYGIFFVANLICETPGLYMNLYTYYGRQPLNFFRLPLLWPVVNSMMPILAGTLVYLLRPYMKGWRVLGVIPLIPAADGAANIAAAWPTWSALNTRLPTPLIWVAGCVTIALASLMIHVIAQIAEAENGAGVPHESSAPVPLAEPQPVPAATS